MSLNPLQRFAFAALLWLPLAFVIWAWWAPLWTWMPILIAKWLLPGVWPTLFSSIEQHGFQMEAITHLVSMQTATDGHRGLAETVLSLNPMIYGYGLPLLAGLTMATPQSAGRRTWQLLLGLICIWLAQSFGIIAESLKLLALQSGPQGLSMVREAGLSTELVALCYQFGYLILPPLVPAVLWILCNRPFIDILTRRRLAEPNGAESVERPVQLK
jgi:hypothetical protein